MIEGGLDFCKCRKDLLNKRIDRDPEPCEGSQGLSMPYAQIE